MKENVSTVIEIRIFSVIGENEICLKLKKIWLPKGGLTENREYGNREYGRNKFSRIGFRTKPQEEFLTLIILIKSRTISVVSRGKNKTNVGYVKVKIFTHETNEND